MAIIVKDRLLHYLEPLLLLAVSIACLPTTIFFHPLLLITSPSAFRSKWFESFWLLIGPKMASGPEQSAHVEDLVSRARGVVLDLGPGTGEQSYHFQPSKITRVYGAEPNAFLHPPLLAKARQAGFRNGQYVALSAGAEPGSLLPALREAGLIPRDGSSLPESGVFDTIISIKSLCSAPQTQLPATVAVLHALLKPGGEYVFFEHLGNETDLLTKAYAWGLDWVWPAFMGGCRLDGKLDAVIRGMGGWEDKRMINVPEFRGFEVFRYVKGVCRKA